MKKKHEIGKSLQDFEDHGSYKEHYEHNHQISNRRIHFAPSVKIGQNAVITGDVVIGDETSIWHNVILRGDVSLISIGRRCNIQDGSILHGQLNQWDVIVGDDVSVGHACILHGCRLADKAFIGMGSIIMNGAIIGSRVMVAAGSLVPQGAKFEEIDSLVMGRPAKVVRSLRPEEIAMIEDTPSRYIEYARQWLS